MRELSHAHLSQALFIHINKDNKTYLHVPARPDRQSPTHIINGPKTVEKGNISTKMLPAMSEFQLYKLIIALVWKFVEGMYFLSCAPISML